MGQKVVTPPNLAYFKAKQDAENDARYMTAAQVTSAIDEAITGVYTIRGSCAFADLPADAAVGDVWYVTDREGMSYVWTGGEWAAMSSGQAIEWNAIKDKPTAYPPDIGYLTTEEIDAIFSAENQEVSS